jgi:hypothetical protein
MSNYFFILLSFSLFGGPLFGQNIANIPSKSLATDRARIKIANFASIDGGGIYKVLRTDINTPLRAACAGFTKQTDTTLDDVFKPEFFKRLHNEGFNTLKLAAYDGIWRGIDFNNSAEVESTLAKFEKIINLTSSNHMYSVITYHPKFGTDPEDYMTAFWKVFAPKFAGRSNVIYELTNEPVANISELTDADFQKYKRIYDLIRSTAPQTHIILFSCAIVSGDSTSVKVGADKFNAKGGIDWTKSSMGYHLYYTGGTASFLRVLHRAYPAIPTEQNFPKRPAYAVLAGVRADDPHRSDPMDNELFAVQTAEKMGAGWFHWHFENLYKFDINYPLLKSDALAKGYFWGIEPYTPPVALLSKYLMLPMPKKSTIALHSRNYSVNGKKKRFPGRNEFLNRGATK